MRALSRRRFLRALLALSALGLLPQPLLAATARRTTTAPLPPGDAASPPPVAGLDGVDSVGSVFLLMHPDEASTSSLRASLGLEPDGDPQLGTRRLARRIKADFEAADIVTVDGWRVSRSEARWAALLHLERGA